MMRQWTMVAVTIGSALLNSSLKSSAQGPKQDAAASPMVRLDLSDLVSVEPAKTDSPAMVLDVRVPTTRTRTVNVTKTRTEKRTRSVQVDGKQVEQNYVVQVPYIENVEQTFTVMQVRKQSVPTDQIQGWDLAGNLLEEQELIDRLSSRPVVFIRGEPWPTNGELDPKQRAVLRGDVLVIYVKSPAGHQEPRLRTVAE